MELLDTKTELEGQGSKVNSEQHGKRGKMELLDTKTGLEGQGSKVNSEQHGKRGKRSSWTSISGSRSGRAKAQHGKGGKAGYGALASPFFHPSVSLVLDPAPRARFWCPGASVFHAFHAFHVVQTSLSSPILKSRSFSFPCFPRFPCCSDFTFEPCPSSPILKSRSFSFPRFPCWLFEPSQHPPRKPWKSWKWWKRPAGDRSGALDGQERT